MSNAKTRQPRLGRGLSSLMAQPVTIEIPANATPPASTTPSSSPPTDTRNRHDRRSNVAAQANVTPATAAGKAPLAPSTDLAPDAGSDDHSELHYILITTIQPNHHQPRQDFDQASLMRLAASIKADGLMQPVVLRRLTAATDPQYELVAGERRWRAAQLAGLTHIPALVRELNDQQQAELALVENLQREDLNPIERAKAFQHLAQNFQLSHDQIARRVGAERSTISNLLRLLELCDSVQLMVRQGHLSGGQARALAGLPDPAAQLALARRCVKEQLSVRQVEAAVRHAIAAAPGTAGPGTAAAPPRSVHLTDLEQQIAQQLGTKVNIRPGRKKGTGQLTIQFFSIDQFEHLLARLGVETE